MRPDSDEPEEQGNDVDREYTAPVLMELGTFEELTQGVAGKTSDGICAASS